MKNAAVLAFTFFLLLSVAAFAQAPGKAAPLTREALAMILGEPAPAGGGCGPAPAKMMFAASKPQPPSGGVGAMATCTANCESGIVQCTGDTCSGADRNCAVFERGHVTCGSTTTWCPTACTSDYCYNCAQNSTCYDCCRCDGGGAISCNNCCACEATQDCTACCRCEGHSITYCSSVCNP
jgi:hypothetical protein